MPRIRCASIDCKWNSDTNMCKYGRTGHTLLIGDTYTHTVNDGVQHFHRCKGYEKSEEAARLESEFLKQLAEKMEIPLNINKRPREFDRLYFGDGSKA